jgi:hypothetical protein
MWVRKLLNVMMPLHGALGADEIVALRVSPVEGRSRGEQRSKIMRKEILKMRFARPLAVLLTGVLCFGCNMMDQAADSSAKDGSSPAPAQTQPAPKPKVVQLFNGKDLSNWTFFSKDPAKKEDVFTVKDGVIHCVGKPAGYIKTNESYTNYNLRLQWRFVKPGNSGVLLRVQEPDAVWPQAIEAQLNSKDAGDIWIINDYPAKLDPARTKGRRTVKMKPTNEKEIGEWNQYDIIVNGPNITLMVNGELQNEATDVKVQPGRIGLQSEGSVIEFRNVELIPLP